MTLDHDRQRALREASQWYACLEDEQLDPAEQQAWQAWLDSSDANRQAWRHIESVAERFDGLRGASNALPVRETLTGLQQQRQSRRGALKSLAVLGAVAGGCWVAMPYQHWQADERSAVGEIRQLQLADNCRAWLNTDSSMNTDFHNGRRQILLQRGDLFVETSHGSAELQSATANADVRCRGGRFALRRRNTDGDLLAVFEGAVTLHGRDGKKRHLRAGQQCHVHRGSMSALGPADPRHESWIHHLLLAHDEPLAELTAELERYRHGFIHVDPAAARLRVTGSFPTQDTDMALDMLSASLPVQVEYPLPWWVNITHS
ncbi:FecR domain-containing protein [Oceanobacter sp. 3_MG-2023]|uniref:FecR domain-containing protein n=1 Tax=Oceanobacter sp. 3_MG-2023 TaxID=3062622 RepID=UPI0027350B06|nr:FecR domain-containing protein [Oceanobacter sp. 3_MG-2023]MDP2506867.1 FecR domain-containing protein [Oceanobacter sp. 3_MG-2023]